MIKQLLMHIGRNSHRDYANSITSNSAYQMMSSIFNIDILEELLATSCTTTVEAQLSSAVQQALHLACQPSATILLRFLTQQWHVDGYHKSISHNLDHKSISSGRLINGIRYVVSSDNSAKVSSIAIYVKVGSRDEPIGKYGMAHFIEHMLFRGTKTRTALQLMSDVYQYGAELNGYTSYDYTSYYAKITSDYLEHAAAIFSDMLFQSVFDQKSIDTERDVVINEINSRNEDTEYCLRKVIQRLVFCGTSLAHSPAGNAKDIKTISRDDLLSLWSDYVPDNIVISIHTSKNSNEVVNMLNKYFHTSCVRAHPISRQDLSHLIQTQPCISTEALNRKEASIGIAFIAPSYRNRMHYVLNLIGVILAGNMISRLSLKLREDLGLAYSINYDLDTYSDIGIFAIILSTLNDQSIIDRAIAVVLAELSDLSKNAIPYRELRQAKDFLLGRIKIDAEDSLFLVRQYGLSMLYQDRAVTIDELLSIYNSINSQEILTAAQQIFDIGKLNIAIIS